MRKRPEKATIRRPNRREASFSGDPACDDPHDAIDQELLGIWLSISRLRQIILRKPPVQSAAAVKKSAPVRKPRRKAA